MQLEIRAFFLDLRRLRVKQQFGILQAQPAFGIVVKVASQFGRALRRIQFQKQFRFYWILQGQRESEQLRRVEKLAHKNRLENAGEIGRITRNQSNGALAIERLKTIEELAGDFQIQIHS